MGKRPWHSREDFMSSCPGRGEVLEKVKVEDDIVLGLKDKARRAFQSIYGC